MRERIAFDGAADRRRAVRRDLRRHRALRATWSTRGSDVRLSLLRGADGDGVRRVRRRPGRRRRRRGRHGRHLGRDQRRRRAGRRRHARSRSTTRDYLGLDARPRSPARRPGSSSRARTACWPSSRSRPPRCCCAARSRSTRSWPARAWSSASLARTLAVGGQHADAAGLGGEYDEVFLPLLGAHQAHNAAVRARRGRGVPRRRRTRPGRSTSTWSGPAFAGVTLAGPAGGRPALARPCVLDAAHNPAGARRHRRGGRRSPSASPGWSAWSAAMADKDVRGMLEALRAGAGRGRGHPDDVRPRAMPADELGRDRRRGVRRRPGRGRRRGSTTRSTRRSTLAEEEGDLGGAGVLVTGSVVTVGEARTLLGGRLTGAGAACGSAPRVLVFEAHRDRLRHAGRDRPRRRRRHAPSGWSAAAVPLLCLRARGRPAARGRWAYVAGSVLQVAADRRPASSSR